MIIRLTDLKSPHHLQSGFKPKDQQDTVTTKAPVIEEPAILLDLVVRDKGNAPQIGKI